MPPTSRCYSPASNACSYRREASWTTSQQLVNGLSLGSLYALIAVGYTVVYGIVQLINFAHGEIFMIGAFGALTVWILYLESRWVGRCPSCSSAA